MSRAVLMAAALLLGLAVGPASAVDPAAREAALRQLKPPKGVGGCIFSAVPADVRREAIVNLLAGKPGTPAALQSAASEAAERCVGWTSQPSDFALASSVTSAFRRSAAAFYLAHQFGIGQEALETAWRAAPVEEKAPFYRVADDFFAPGLTVSDQALDAGGFARKAGLDIAATSVTEGFLRMYFINTAVSERAEALLAAEETRSP